MNSVFRVLCFLAALAALALALGYIADAARVPPHPDIDRRCQIPTPAPTDVIGRAIADACAQLRLTPTPATR